MSSFAVFRRPVVNSIIEHKNQTSCSEFSSIVFYQGHIEYPGTHYPQKNQALADIQLGILFVQL